MKDMGKRTDMVADYYACEMVTVYLGLDLFSHFTIYSLILNSPTIRNIVGGFLILVYTIA